MEEQTVEQQQISLDRDKWRDEVRLRERELDLKERQQRSQEEDTRLKREELNRSRWSSPLIIAILGAAAAATGNLLVNRQNSADTQVLEKSRAEAARILEVVKTADPDKAAENLRVLMDTYLISDPFTRDHVQAYLAQREPGKGLALPAATQNVSSAVVPSTAFQPVPKGGGKMPYHLDLANVPGVAVADIEKSGKLVFQVTGNTGGVQKPAYQAAVAEAMTMQLRSPSPDGRPAFMYLLGNIVFFNGEADNYYAQFYRPYAFYPAPIFAIPGNHDGVSVAPGGASSLQAFIANFCTAEPVLTQSAGGITRKTMTQPNPYWTLRTPYATIVGMYTNVPSGGALDEDQRNWLSEELKTAPADKALIVAMHHSPFSFAASNLEGSPRMVTVLEQAINTSRRVPNAVLTASNFDYQRIEVEVPGSKIPFFVIGNGGYPHLHPLAKEPAKSRNAKPGVALVAGNDRDYGFATFEVTRDTIQGRMNIAGVAGGASAPGNGIGDTFSYSAKAIILRQGENVSWPVSAPPADEN